MKRYVKSNEYIYSGQKISTVDTFDKVINLAKTNIIGCVSACRFYKDKTPEEINKLNEQQTKNLDLEISDSYYDYFETFGGWVNPENGSTTEETSFIVIGPKYEYQDQVDEFRDKMIDWCGRYGQWAVLIIDKIYEDDLDDIQLHDRYLTYRNFYDPKFRMSDYADDDERVEEMSVYNDLQKTEHVDITQVEAYYLDADGDVVKYYNNVSPKHIGQYFTQLARHQGASRFTLLASTYLRHGYIRTTPRSEYIMSSLSSEEIEDKIYSQRESELYKRLLNSTYHRIFD